MNAHIYRCTCICTSLYCSTTFSHTKKKTNNDKATESQLVHTSPVQWGGHFYSRWFV